MLTNFAHARHPDPALAVTRRRALGAGLKGDNRAVPRRDQPALGPCIHERGQPSIPNCEVLGAVVEAPRSFSSGRTATAQPARLFEHGYGDMVISERSCADQTSQTGANYRDARRVRVQGSLYVSLVRADVDARRMGITGPAAHRAKHGRLRREGAVELPKTPQDAAK